MSRERFRTPEEEVVTLTNRVLWLLKHASPEPSDKALFTQLMNEANAKGLSWIEGLEYVLQRRDGPQRGIETRVTAVS